MIAERKNITAAVARIFITALLVTGCFPGQNSNNWSSCGSSRVDTSGIGRAPTSSSSSSSSGSQGPSASSSSGNLDPKCVDPAGFDGRGCFKCTPTTSDELLNACTTSKFEEFENADRIAGFVDSDPSPSIPGDLGATPPPFDPGTTTDPTLPPAPPCPIDIKPNPVMVLGGTGFPFETIARAMGGHATIFFQEKSSCEGVSGMVLNQPKMQGEIVYFDTDGTKNRCVLSQAHPADITTSALFAPTCAGQAGLDANAVTIPADVQDFLGPVSPVMFVVPATSSQRALSAEAGYKVFGFGDESGVSPWENEQFIFRRTSTSGNQQTVARTLGIQASDLRGRDSSGSTAMLNALLSSTAPEQTIGISSSEIVDTHRDVMKSLAYKHYSQPVAFYPDSDPAKLDRKNVRDGHYFMWMPLHVLARTRAGDPVAAANPLLADQSRDEAVKTLVFVMVNRQQGPMASVDLLGALKRTGNVPQCAMHVRRTKEGAPLEHWDPQVWCDCAFEAAAPGETPATCQACKDSADCSGSKGTCSFGFCE